jgi:hypothetical protein
MVSNPVGYNFRLYADGTWKLLTANDELASGKVTLSGKTWMNLKLRCQSDKITAFIDGQNVCEISDRSYLRGLAGIGCSFDPVSFDQFKISDIHAK